MDEVYFVGVLDISIHALREEGDSSGSLPMLPDNHFNPRPPRGGRRKICLFRRSMKGISIHALREEGDVAIQYLLTNRFYFNPRPPRGGRP